MRLGGHAPNYVLESGYVILEMKDGPYEPLEEEDILQ